MIRNLFVVVAASLLLLVAVVMSTAGHGPRAVAGGVLLWAPGIGLAIVRHLVQRLGGTVDLDSREGVGTRARVALPTPKGGDPP